MQDSIALKLIYFIIILLLCGELHDQNLSECARRSKQKELNVLLNYINIGIIQIVYSIKTTLPQSYLPLLSNTMTGE